MLRVQRAIAPAMPPAYLEPDEAHHQDHIGARHYLRDGENIGEIQIGRPPLFCHKVANVRENRGESRRS